MVRVGSPLSKGSWEGGELLLGSTLEHLRHLEHGIGGVGKCLVFIGRWAILVGFIWIFMDLYGIDERFIWDLNGFSWIYVDLYGIHVRFIWI